MCERSSRVSGSMMANSSSMPRVNVCSFMNSAEEKHPQISQIYTDYFGNPKISCLKAAKTCVIVDDFRSSSLREVAERTFRHCGFDELAPAEVVAPGNV